MVVFLWCCSHISLLYRIPYSNCDASSPSSVESPFPSIPVDTICFHGLVIRDVDISCGLTLQPACAFLLGERPPCLCTSGIHSGCLTLVQCPPPQVSSSSQNSLTGQASVHLREPPTLSRSHWPEHEITPSRCRFAAHHILLGTLPHTDVYH